MTYRVIFLMLLAFTQLRIYAQQSITLIPQTKLPECPDIAYSSSVFFTNEMQKREFDTARKILEYWEGKCGMREPVLRAKILLAFATGESTDSIINQDNFYLFDSYQHRAKMIHSRNFSYYDYNKFYFGFVPIGQEFDSFTQTYFKESLHNLENQTTNYLLARFYSSNNTDTIFIEIQKDDYKETALAREYFSLVNRYLKMPETNCALVVGAWIPTGGITHMGIHPQIGFLFGVKYGKLNVDLDITFKFLKSKARYYAKRVRSDQSVVYTDKFFGGYFGLDFGYDIWTKQRNEFQVLLGAGVDGFDAIKADTARKLKAETTWTYNFNFGIGYRYYINPVLYLGWQLKYNIVDYSLTGAVNFTGNPVTINFVVGGLSNRIKRSELEALKYKWRR